MELFYCLARTEGFDGCDRKCPGCRNMAAPPQDRDQTPQSNKPVIVFNNPGKRFSMTLEKDVYDRLLILSEIDNRTMGNLVDTIIRNQLGMKKYNFKDLMEIVEEEIKANH